MESHTTQFRGSFASPPTEHLEGFPPAVYDTSDDLQLGTKANPIVIDETSPPDSIPDVIATYIDGDHGFDDTGHLCSDAETEIIASPAFWDAFLDENFSHGDEVHIASLSASAQSNPTRSHSEAIQDVGIPTVAQVDDPMGNTKRAQSIK
ncbi:hypothetical protein N7512_001929 [Penicillium capsulatum]|nr:hypothetical protein N7512_001929 [Penicillium capsulatum]